jgi:gluconate 5-dehydrogenase
MDLRGRVALIAGGHGPIARACAQALAELGCTVVLAARNVDSCADLAAEIGHVYGTRADAYALDVASETAGRDVVAGLVRDHSRIDIAINNAATFWAAPPEDVPFEKGWRRVLDVNLSGTFAVCQQVGRAMLEAGRGSIINIASSVAFVSFMPDEGSTLSYTVSKGAMVTLTRDLATQWAGRGVRVNAIAPGSLDAGLMASVPAERQEPIQRRIPAGRFGRPHELKGAVAYLASDLSSYVTGSVLRVDGGQTAV